MITFEAVSHAYTAREKVLDQLSMEVEPSQVVGLLGRNGAGKTTLIRLAMGLLAAQTGRIRILGKDPRADSLDLKRRIGYVSEDQLLPGFLRVGEVIALYRKLYPTWDNDMASRLMRRFQVRNDAKIKTLSKGEARQVSLLCAIAHRPEVLLLDEPAGSLDPSTRREFLETSIDLLNEEGTTIVFSSHHMTDVERMANRIVMLHGGKVVIDQDLDRIKEQFCLAILSRDANADLDKLSAESSCISLRERAERIHLVFNKTPEQARDLIKVEGARFTPLNLEELFVEIAGGRK